MNGSIFNLTCLRPAPPPRRRGNTIVLVTGILVLLVIIATAYVTRTQAGRATSSAVLRSEQRQNNAQVIADFLSHEVTEPLFVRLLPATFGTPLSVLGSNALRFPALPDAVRYGVDGNSPYNFAPYHVAPFTNWPDPASYPPAFNLDPAKWPKGPGNTNPAIFNFVLVAEGNPVGNPGFGDCRWLRDSEPMRWDSNGDGIPDAFAQYRHVSYLARPDNGIRVVANLSNVEASLITDLNLPVEQWPAVLPVDSGGLYRFSPLTGDAIFPGPQAFDEGWFGGLWLAGTPFPSNTSPSSWFGFVPGVPDLYAHQEILSDPIRLPLNCYRLRDLNGNGVSHEVGERPQDEFLPLDGSPPTARWYVCRVLADADGDGYTDSFWYLMPTPIQDGIRQVVAIAVVDNCGKLNVNVATRFIRNNTDFLTPPNTIDKKTRGLGPTDLALVGQLSDGAPGNDRAFGNWNVGLFDNWEHWFSGANGLQAWYPVFVAGAWNWNIWNDWQTELGMYKPGFAAVELIPDRAMRLRYWRECASSPLSADFQSRFTPFTIADEIELRMYEGQNYPWITSRFENATQSDVGSNAGILHGGTPREESNEYQDQLLNRELVTDSRHRVTLFSAARNDIMPPSTWVFDPTRLILDPDLNEDGVFDATDREIFQFGMRKFDLRIGPGPVRIMGPFGPNSAVTGRPLPRIDTIDYNTDPADYNRKLGLALRDRLERCLIDSQPNLPGQPGTYYGVGPAEFQWTHDLAAGFAANIWQWRDRVPANPAADISPLVESVPTSSDPSGAIRFMGMETQPFLLEAFIGHVYKAVVIPNSDINGTPYSNAGNYVILEPPGITPNANRRSTIVVVQIANPYNAPIDLVDRTNPAAPTSKYEISVFGQDVPLWQTNDPEFLEPATDEKPTTAVFYLLPDDLSVPGVGTDANVDDKWINFLDIYLDPTGPNLLDNLTRTSIVKRVTGWSSVRDLYDTSAQPAIVLLRQEVLPAPAAPVWVAVDRIDPPNDQKFGEAVNDLEDNKPDQEPIPMNAVSPATDPGPYPLGYDLGPQALGYKHWVQWVRVTRAWGVDVSANGTYDQNEKNPRYVFGDRAVIKPGTQPSFVNNEGADGITHGHGGDRYKFDADPDDINPAVDPPAPWFTRSYYTASNQVVQRKPTFFDMNRGDIDHPGDPAQPPCSSVYFPWGWSYPDKGWYSQEGVNGPDDPVMTGTGTGGGGGGTSTVTLPFAMQMLQKDDDFEQVGELLNVWLFGHKLNMPGTDPSLNLFTYEKTITTFSEFLSRDNLRWVGTGIRANRMQVNAGGNIGAVIGVGDPTNMADPRHSVPPLPAGARVLDAVVCDGTGLYTGPGSLGEFANAKGFDGTGTPGLLNLNTASPEVLRSQPDWYRLVHETGRLYPAPTNAQSGCSGQPTPGNEPILYNNYNPPSAADRQHLVTNGSEATALLPRVMLPEALEHYRERFSGNVPPPGTGTPPFTGIPGGPNYLDRGSAPNGLHGERGIPSIGELLLLTRPAQFEPMQRLTAGTASDWIFMAQWRIDQGVAAGVDPALAKPFWFIDPSTSARSQVSLTISTDRQGMYDPYSWNNSTNPPSYSLRSYDTTAGDVEEANALFAGASNLVTTRSDTFTVYFRVRSFRQNTSVNPPVWDATNPEYIVDDSRYVMLVDRSTVNKPGDKPKILYLEKLPN